VFDVAFHDKSPCLYGADFINSFLYKVSVPEQLDFVKKNLYKVIMATPKKNTKSVRTRRSILDALKSAGPQDAQAIAAKMGITAMAIRQHLYALQNEKLVEFEEEPREMGRPAKMWTLTADADRFYPNGHADLTVDLIRSVQTAFGEKGMEKLLAVRAKEMESAYSKDVKPSQSLKKRLKALAVIRTNEGYMAEVQTDDDGTLLFVENHCPICEAATECQGLCAKELDVFQHVLGSDVEVERTDHIQAGARRCAYRVSKI
jgi:predicted ArsR family transcriptional regulator